MRTVRAALLLLTMASAAVADPRPLQVDPASEVRIAVKATVDSFSARLNRFDASVLIDSETGVPSGAELRFHFVDVKTGKEARDREMNHWQDTDKHPDGSFRMTSVTPAAGGGYLARGILDLHGVEREISMPLSITHRDDSWYIDGEASLDTRQFDLPVIRKLGLLKVSPEVKVLFHLRGTLAGR